MSDVKQKAKLVTRHLIGYSLHTYKLTNTHLHYFIVEILHKLS